MFTYIASILVDVWWCIIAMYHRRPRSAIYAKFRFLCVDFFCIPPIVVWLCYQQNWVCECIVSWYGGRRSFVISSTVPCKIENEFSVHIALCNSSKSTSEFLTGRSVDNGIHHGITVSQPKYHLLNWSRYTLCNFWC